MSDSIIRQQLDDVEEKDKMISILRNENEVLKKRNKELEELLQRGEKRLRETNQATNRDEVIPCRHESVINITVGTSPSRFQWKLGRRDVGVSRPQRPKSYPYRIGDDKVIGIEEDVQNLVQQLINPKSGNSLAIVGMGGSGKTTLARKIYNHDDISRHFDCTAWICVSQVWSQESVLKDIFSQTTGRNSNNLSVTEIVQEIHKLLGDKSYFVVLDDVWEPNVLTKIMVPTARSHASKFLITTRNRKVISFPDLDFSVHEPRRLTNHQSLELFKKIAFGNQNNDLVDLAKEMLAKEMLRKCDGLPLAVISLAGLLRTKTTIQEWKKVGNNVSSKMFKDQVGPSDYGRVEDILGLSYSDLNHILKSCFMYLSLFPEDDVIPCGMIMRCWMAEGFFKSIQLEANENIEDVAMEYLDELIQRCLVQIVRVNYAEIAKTIRVHDLLRDLALKKARAKYFSNTLASGSSTMSRIRFLRLGINGDNYRDGEEMAEDLGICSNLNLTPTQNQDKVSRRLRTFIQFHSYIKIVGWSNFHLNILFTNYTVLRVLILNGLRGKKIPDAIGSLIHLRYFRLSFYSRPLQTTGYLPDSLQNLRNLLSFECRVNYEEEIGKLPNLKQMKQLRYLRLPWTLSRHEELLNLHHLPRLKVLWGISSGKWMMTEMKYLSPTIEKLWIYNIEKSEELEEVYQCPSIVQDNLYALKLKLKYDELELRLGLSRSGPMFELQKLQHCSKLKKLYLEGAIAATGVPLVFPRYLLKLELKQATLDDQNSFADALQRLTYLKFLELANDAYVDVDLTFPANSLLYLEKLQLSELKYLRKIHVMEGAMPLLKSFHIMSCLNLEVIHVMKGAMQHLKSFYVDCWHNLKVLWGIRAGKWMVEIFRFLNSRVEKLGIFYIKNSEELNLVYQFQYILHNLCALKLKLRTNDTKFELHKLQHCTKLTRLYLEGAIAATGIPFVFPPYLIKLQLKWSRLDDQDSFADALQRLTCLKFLKLTYDAYVGVDLTFPANSLLNLEKLQLYHLTNVERIHVMEGAMPHLKSFDVGHCKKLKVIPQCLWHLLRRINDIEEANEDDMEDEREVNENGGQE